MKKLLAGLVAPMLIAVPLAASAQTQRPADRGTTTGRDTTTTRDRDTARDTKKDGRPAWRNDQGLHESRQLVGTRVKNLQGKDIGEIDDLMIDAQSGKISHVVIGLGGFMGVGERKVVVPWSDLKFAATRSGKKPEATMDQAKLESAPRYERTASADRDRSATPAASPRSTSPGYTAPSGSSTK